MDVTAKQARVLACLIEKAETTPDSYPLSTNALRAACNQTTNRDPVVEYTEREVDELMLELRQLGLARTVTGAGHRVGKHKHIADEALGLDGHELAVLSVLLLRGPQTLREVVTRTERYASGPLGDDSAVEGAIDRLAARPEPFVQRLERRPGEREPRIVQVWTEDGQDEPAQSFDRQPAPAHEVEPPLQTEAVPSLADRVASLEATMAEQQRRIDRIASEFGID